MADDQSSIGGRRNHSSASPFEPVYGYSRAVRVENRIDVAGCAPIEPDGTSTPGDAGIQASRCLTIIREALEALGGSPADVVRTRMYITDPADADLVGRAHGAMFGEADIATLDVNRDGFVDVLYAVDTRGNVWRINAADPTTNESYKASGTGSVSAWKINKIATVGQWGTGSEATEHRKFMYAPSVVTLGNQAIVLVGTGDREKPTDGSQAALVNNRFYGFRDNVGITTGITPIVGYGASPADLTNVTALSTLDPATVNKGWYRELSTTTTPYEQVITTPLTLGGITYFNTYQAKNTSANQCSNLGTGRAYQVNFQTGLPIPGNDLVTQFIAGGIPPSPVGGVVVVDGKQVPFVIGGPGPTPISPQKITPKIRADRKPIYRVQRID